MVWPNRKPKRKLTRQEAQLQEKGLTKRKSLDVWKNVGRDAVSRKTVEAVLDQESARQCITLKPQPSSDSEFIASLSVPTRTFLCGAAVVMQGADVARAYARSAPTRWAKKSRADTKLICRAFMGQMSQLRAIENERERDRRAAMSFPSLWRQLEKLMGKDTAWPLCLPGPCTTVYSYGTFRLQGYMGENLLALYGSRLYHYISDVQRAVTAGGLPRDLYFLVMHYATGIHRDMFASRQARATD